MKIKVVIIAVCVLAVLGTAGAFAGNVVSNILSEKNVNTQAESVEPNNNVYDINAEISGEANTYNSEELSDKYAQMVAVLNQSITDSVQFNQILLDFEYLSWVYGLTQEQLEYIYDLIISGYDAQTVMDASYFWIDTRDDITIIKSMCDLKSELDGVSHWLENAYDIATNKAHGSLTAKEVEEYYSQGLTADDILTADGLCRKGSYTIQAILTAKLNGKSFADIAKAIRSGEPIDGFELFSLSDNSDIENPQSLLKADELAGLTGESVAVIIEDIENGEDIEGRLRDERDNKISQIYIRLQNSGLLKEIGGSDNE